MGDMGFALQVTAIALGALVVIAFVFVLLSWLLQLLASSVSSEPANRWEAPVAVAEEEGARVESGGSSAGVERAPVAAGTPPQPSTSQAVQPAPAGVERAVTSPMPGTVISINVNVASAVKAGDVLVIIESMKVQNEIKAPISGTVKEIHVQQGANVRRGERLVTIAA